MRKYLIDSQLKMKFVSRKQRMVKTVLFLVLFFVAGIVYLLYFLPLPDSIIGYRTDQTTKMYDKSGVLLYEVLQPEEGRKSHLNFAQFPEKFIQATLAAEDSNYYSHWGVDLGAIFRAVWLNVKNQDIVSGGSTITQQLVRNLLGTTRDRSLGNKIMESLYAIRLNQISDKNQILERYLNTVYFGNVSYGAEAAALSYFGKHVYDLDLAEMSLLAGIPQNPSLYNPLTHLDDSQGRQSEVLDRMVKNNWITQTEADEAKKEKLQLAVGDKNKKAPHFVNYVLDNLETALGKEQLFYGGLQIHTTLDLYTNEEIGRIIQNNLAKIPDKHVTNGAVMVVENKTGNIIAMVGSKDFYDSSIDGQVNVVLRKRQPGSSFKPVTYLAAFEKGWTPATTIADIPTKFLTEEGTPYTPKNYDLDYHGLVTVRDALANSYNIPAVKALEFAGPKQVIALAENMGITSLDKGADFYGLALTLGDGEMRLYDLVQAYSVLANQGLKQDFSFVDSIDPTPADLPATPEAERVVPADMAYLITNILSDNSARLPSFGENSVLNIKDVAAKTGTSRNFKDNWTIGYTPAFTVGVWVGNSDSSAMIDTSGVEGAGPIFHDVVQLLTKTYGSQKFTRPDNIVEKEICLPSGNLPTAICPQRRKEVFIAGTEPKEKDSLWTTWPDGQLSISFPPELLFWAKEKGYPILPDLSQEKNYLKIENPQNLDEFQINPNVPEQYQKITLRAGHSSDIKDIEWFLNDQPIGKGEELDWQLREGNFIIRVQGGSQKDSIAIVVNR